MNIAVIATTPDVASMNIRKALLSELPLKEIGEQFDGHPVLTCTIGERDIRLYTSEKRSIHAEHIDRELSESGFIPGIIIFITKHQGGAGIKSLSCHAPGNWDKAEMGGTPKILCPAPASMLKVAAIALKEESEKMEWRFSLEVTHHGPELETPVMFMEIGSTPEEWPIPEAGIAVARAVRTVLETPHEEKQAVLLLGGGHYSHYGEKVQLHSGYACGHACPKFMLPYLDRDMLMQALDKTISPEKPIVLLDWKGLGPDKARIRDMLEEEGIEWSRSDKFFKPA